MRKRNDVTLPMRIVLTGSECTGKTTLASVLAQRLGAPWIPEFARTYAASHVGPLTAADIEPIARGQIAGEDEAFRERADRILILDTDLLSTVIYARHYYGQCPGWILAESLRRTPDIYLLAGLDVSWKEDGIRDRENSRQTMQELFREELRRRQVPFLELHGSVEARLRQAMDAIEKVTGDRAAAGK